MATKYKLTITEQDMETLNHNKETGEPIMLFLQPINPEEGLRELQIEVMYGERPVAPTTNEPVAEPTAELAGVESATDANMDADITQAELTPGFTGESAVTSLDSFFRINEKKEEKEVNEVKTKKEDSKEKSDKPKFGSPEWRALYQSKKSKKKKK